MNGYDPVQEKLAASLTAKDTGLLPFLPYLLQDLYELGGSPKDTAAMLGTLPHEGMRVLDLACGKGAVSIHLAKTLGVEVKGIDLFPEFIEFARAKAEEEGVAGLCRFAVGDINEAVQAERGWDCVVFSAAGSILGPPEATLRGLAATLRPGGHILLDDSYLKDGLPAEAVQYMPEAYIKRAQWEALFAKLGLRVAGEHIYDDSGIEDDRGDVEAIRRRAAELSARHPDKKALFEDYVRSQEDEVDDIENSLVNLQWLLQKS